MLANIAHHRRACVVGLAGVCLFVVLAPLVFSSIAGRRIALQNSSALRSLFFQEDKPTDSFYDAGRVKVLTGRSRKPSY
jgi:hypothetical protein